MNGELKCHNSESIVIEIGAIVVHAYVCASQFLCIAAEARGKQTGNCSVAGRTDC